jgi:hypothetical protein
MVLDQKDRDLFGLVKLLDQLAEIGRLFRLSPQQFHQHQEPRLTASAITAPTALTAVGQFPARCRNRVSDNRSSNDRTAQGRGQCCAPRVLKTNPRETGVAANAPRASILDDRCVSEKPS